MLVKTIDILRHGIPEHLHSGAQIYVSHQGRTVCNEAVGEAKPGVRMTPDSITLWMSATKPIAAIAIAMLWEQGKLALDDRVQQIIPGFGARGKETITLRHILTHTAGFRGPMNNYSTDPWEQIIARICEMRLEPDWIPGKKAGYHVATSWFILGEIVRRISEMPFDQFVRQRIFEPLGCDSSHVGMPEDFYHANRHRIADMVTTNPAGKARNSTMDSQWECAMVAPGANGRGPIRELARIYERLFLRSPLPPGEGQGEEVDQSRFEPARPLTPTLSQRERGLITPQTADAITARHRTGLFDHTFRHNIDWGLGFILDSKQYNQPTLPYNFGPHSSPRTFGHSGNQSSCAFCDPEHQLVVAWTCNGQPGEDRHQARQNAINAAIYEDLRLIQPIV